MINKTVTSAKSKEKFCLPDKYKMKTFPHETEFSIPGFGMSHPGEQIKCLCPSNIKIDSYFEDFINIISHSINNKTHYPILRISDGELEFLFGRIWFNKREAFLNNILNFFRRHHLAS